MIVQLYETKQGTSWWRLSGDQVKGQALDMVLRELLILVKNDGQIPWLWLVPSYKRVLVWRLGLPVTKRRMVVGVSNQEVGGGVRTIVRKNPVNSEGHRLVRNVFAISERLVAPGELFTLYTGSKVKPCSQSSEKSFIPMDRLPVRVGVVGKVSVGLLAIFADNIEVKTVKIVQLVMPPYIVEAVQELKSTAYTVLFVKSIHNMATRTSIKTCEMSTKDVSMSFYFSCSRECDFYMKIAGKFNSLVACGDIEINPGPNSNRLASFFVVTVI